MMKYAAAILTALALAGTAWAMVVAMRPMPGAVPATDTSPALSQQLKSCDREVLHLRGLEKTLDQVNRVTVLSQSPVAMLTLHVAKPPASTTAAQSLPDSKPDISLVYVSPELQKVVINGALLGTGDLLPDGGRLIAITQDQIVVEQNGHRRVLHLPEPHVLGMVPKPTNAR